MGNWGRAINKFSWKASNATALFVEGNHLERVTHECLFEMCFLTNWNRLWWFLILRHYTANIYCERSIAHASPLDNKKCCSIFKSKTWCSKLFMSACLHSMSIYEPTLICFWMSGEHLNPSHESCLACSWIRKWVEFCCIVTGGKGTRDGN